VVFHFLLLTQFENTSKQGNLRNLELESKEYTLVSMGLWFQGDRHGGAQEAYSSVSPVLHMLDSFFCNSCPTSAEDKHLSTNSKFLLYHVNSAFHFCLASWAPFGFWEADFHHGKGREALSRSHNGLNKADDKGTKVFCRMHGHLKFLFLKFLLIID
jgi:hypothetical protein